MTLTTCAVVSATIDGRVISGRHLSKHGTDRETYMAEHALSPDELIAKDFRVLRSSRPGFKPYGQTEWIGAI